MGTPGSERVSDSSAPAQDLDVSVGPMHADPLPIRISRLACSTPTTAGKPYSRAITAPWVIRPPTSVTRPAMATNKGDQLGSVYAVTRMSPASRSACAMS